MKRKHWNRKQKEEVSNKQELIWQSEAIRGHNEKKEEQRREISMGDDLFDAAPHLLTRLFV